MTEKRFELKWRDTGEVLYDNETGLEHRIYSPDYRFHVRDMMNEFDKKNKELKKENEQLKQDYDKFAKFIRRNHAVGMIHRILKGDDVND